MGIVNHVTSHGVIVGRKDSSSSRISTRSGIMLMLSNDSQTAAPEGIKSVPMTLGAQHRDYCNHSTILTKLQIAV